MGRHPVIRKSEKLGSCIHAPSKIQAENGLCRYLLINAGNVVSANVRVAIALPRVSTGAPVHEALTRRGVIRGSRLASNGLAFSHRSACKSIIAAPVSTMKVARMPFTLPVTL